MFGWFGRSSGRRTESEQRTRLTPEAKWVLECEGDLLCATDDKGAVRQLPKSELNGVIIETNDSGPWGADVWWLLFGRDDRVAIAYPQGATGEDVMLNYLTSLPGFDHTKMIDAMRSTTNAVFPVWRRS